MRLNPLDVLFSEYIRRRAIKRTGGCERCLQGKTSYKQLQCSHFIGRARRVVRWDEDNSVGLCAGCHMYLTAHPIEHVKYFMDYLGEEKVDLLMARNRERQKPDTEAITLYLEAKIEELDKSQTPTSMPSKSTRKGIGKRSGSPNHWRDSLRGLI